MGDSALDWISGGTRRLAQNGGRTLHCAWRSGLPSWDSVLSCAFGLHTGRVPLSNPIFYDPAKSALHLCLGLPALYPLIQADLFKRLVTYPAHTTFVPLRFPDLVRTLAKDDEKTNDTEKIRMNDNEKSC